MKRNFALCLAACLAVPVLIAQAADVERDTDRRPVADPALDIGGVAARRMENGRLMFEISTAGEPRVEHMRIFLDTDSPSGAPETGADFMLEGRRFYSRPPRARGWQWDEIESPVVVVDGRRVICVLPALPELQRGAWRVETMDDRLQAVDRVPEKGSVSYVLSELPVWQPPMRASPADIHDLLDYAPFSLSVRLDSELKSVRWTDLAPPWPALEWTPSFQDSAVPLQVWLQDRETGEDAALEPDSVRRHEDALLFEGKSLGVTWTILVEPAGTGAVRVTGRLADERDRLLRVEVRSPLAGSDWIWHDDFRSERALDAGGEKPSNVMPGPFGERSVYPFGVVSRDGQAVSVETDPFEPRLFRVLARTEEQAVAIQYDLALTQGTSNFPGRATFRCAFRSLPIGPGNPFRHVVADYQMRYPARRLARSEHLDPSVLIQLAPCIQRVPLSAGIARTGENVELLLRLGLMEHGRGADLAAATLLGACLRADGKMAISYDAGAAVSVNVDPDAGATTEWPVTRAAAEWNFMRGRMEDPRIKGVYFDAMQNESPDYRGAAIGVADFPCVYEPAVAAPCLANSFSGIEFMALVSRALAARGTVLVGSSADEPTPFHVHYMDGIAEQVEWLKGDSLEPDEVGRLIARRVLAGKKPVALWVNGPFDTTTPEAVKRCFEEALFWGFVPRFHRDSLSGTLHGAHPEWGRRDQRLADTYAPLAGRLADAGWTPAGGAFVNLDTVHVEHFGTTQAVRHLTIRNDDEWIADAHLRFENGSDRMVVFNPLNGECAVVHDGLVLRLLPDEIQVLDVFDLSDMEEELAFLRAWPGGAGEGDAGRRTLESLKAERAAGMECEIRVPTPSVRDEANRLEIVIHNKSESVVALSGLRVIGNVFREADFQDMRIEPATVSTASVSFLGSDVPASGWLEVLWTLARKDFELSCARFIRPRVVDAVEFRASPAQVEAPGLETDLSLIAINHSAVAKSFTVTWRGDFRGGMRQVELEPFSTQTIALPVRARRAGQGEMYAVVERDEQRLAVIRFDVHLQPGDSP